MNPVLLDTHAFLWFVAGDEQLTRKGRDAIEADGNEIVVSIASIGEISIKVAIGKLIIHCPLRRLIPSQLEKNGFELLPLGVGHCLRVSELPMHHRDPFDRMLIAQALEDGMPIVSGDSAFDAYGVPRIW